MVSDAEGVGHDGQRGVDGAGRGEETSVDDVEVLEVVDPAVEVEDRGLRVVAKPKGPHLVGDAGDRNFLGEIGARGKMVDPVARAVQNPLQLFQKTSMRLAIFLLAVEMDPPQGVDEDPIVRIGEILRSDPPADRVIGHRLQDEFGGEKGSVSGEHGRFNLAQKLDVAQREFRVVGAEVKIVQADRLLKGDFVFVGR